ncbi:MAG TPA: methyltransferase domain-containing protein, partial [Nitrospirae bacterium]|nr:methyltransferase domain-containing protein [Nitrospirota bacterium]
MSRISKQAGQLRKMWSGFQSARALFTANNYRVFDHLAKQKTSDQLAKDIGADKRATEILLDALTGLGLLKKQGRKYRNAAMASRFLVSGERYYQGNIIRHADFMWNSWSGLDNVLKTGDPHRRSRDHNAFILGMHDLAVLKARQVIRSIGVRNVKKALDLGGGPGTYSMEMASKGVHTVLFDTPETIKIAGDVINKAKVKGIEFLRGDFFHDDLGKDYDLILISQILHSYSVKDNISLLKKCSRALNSNGRVAIQDFLISEDRTRPVQSALFSINMLVNNEGRCYSPGEIRGWFLKAGFKGVRKASIEDGLLMTAR